MDDVLFHWNVHGTPVHCPHTHTYFKVYSSLKHQYFNNSHQWNGYSCLPISFRNHRNVFHLRIQAQHFLVFSTCNHLLSMYNVKFWKQYFFFLWNRFFSKDFLFKCIESNKYLLAKQVLEQRIKCHFQVVFYHLIF